MGSGAIRPERESGSAPRLGSPPVHGGWVPPSKRTLELLVSEGERNAHEQTQQRPSSGEMSRLAQDIAGSRGAGLRPLRFPCPRSVPTLRTGCWVRLWFLLIPFFFHLYNIIIKIRHSQLGHCRDINWEKNFKTQWRLYPSNESTPKPRGRPAPQDWA